MCHAIGKSYLENSSSVDNSEVLKNFRSHTNGKRRECIASFFLTAFLFCRAQIFLLFIPRHQDYSHFSKIKMCFPLPLPFFWECTISSVEKWLDRWPGNWELRKCQGLLPNAWWAGKFVFLIKELEVLVYLSYEKRPGETSWPWEAWKHLILNPTLRASWKPTRQSRSPSSLLFVGTIFVVFTENRSSN